MKRFLNNIALFAFISFTILELSSRIVTDPYFFYFADTFNEKSTAKPNVFDYQKTEHVDYIFLGSSRVPAAISAKEFAKNEKDKVAIMAGRGGNTFGVQYQALAQRLKQFPDFLKGAAVFLEYPGWDFYTDSFESQQYFVYESLSRGMDDAPQLMIPHLDNASFLEFIKHSQNTVGTKSEVAILYFSSGYRSSYIMNDVYHKLDIPLIGAGEAELVEKGGIRANNYSKALEYAKIAARLNAKRLAERPPLTKSQLDSSALKALNDLIIQHGGKLYLFRVPLHSLRSSIYAQGEKNTNNKRLFEKWLEEEAIPLLDVDSFHYQDEDFPDIWHLALGKREQFTKALYDSFNKESGLKMNN